MDKENKPFLLKNELNWFMINEDKCLACKLFASPLFFAFGGYFAF